MMKKFSAFALIFLLAACSSPNQKSDAAGTPMSTESASPAQDGANFVPDISLKDLETNEPLKLSDLSKPVVVTFWASWCTTCRKEFPLWRDKALANNVIGINVQDARGGNKLRVLAYNLMKDNDTAFPSYVDSDEILTSHLGIVGLPVTIVVASDGRILERHDGVITKKTLLRFVALTRD